MYDVSPRQVQVDLRLYHHPSHILLFFFWLFPMYCCRKRKGMSLRRWTSLNQWMPKYFDEKIIAFQCNWTEKKQYSLVIWNRQCGSNCFVLWYVNKRGSRRERGKECKYLHSWMENPALHCDAQNNCRQKKVATIRDIWKENNAKRKLAKWCTVWGQPPGTSLQLPYLLVWNIFHWHLRDGTKRNHMETKTDIAVIPGLLTTVLQPRGVSVDKPFKDSVRKLYT